MTIAGIETLIASFVIGWLFGFVTKCVGISKREGADILRKAAEYGFWVDGKTYECREVR